MTRDELNIIQDFKTTTKNSLLIIKQFLEVIIPVNDTDKNIIDVGYDMIESLIDDINNANMNELSAVFDISKIIDNWESVQPIIQDIDNYNSTSDFVREVVERYEQFEE